MSFRVYQAGFAAHLRDPAGAPRPAGVPARRMRVYSQLLYNNIENFLRTCFPVCRQVLGQRRWTRLVRGFFRDHACASPYFRRIPEEFLGYLASEWPDAGEYPEFLRELAHYEWVELDLETSNLDIDQPSHDPDGDLLTGRPLPNPVMHVLTYRFPVQRISARFKPKSAPSEATYLLVFRDADLEIRFVDISAATFLLLETIRQDAGLSGRAAIGRLAREMRHPDPEAMLRHGGAMLADLRRLGALIGTRVG